MTASAVYGVFDRGVEIELLAFGLPAQTRIAREARMRGQFQMRWPAPARRRTGVAVALRCPLDDRAPQRAQQAEAIVPFRVLHPLSFGFFPTFFSRIPCVSLLRHRSNGGFRVQVTALLGWFSVGIGPQESIVVAIRCGHDILLRMKA